MRVDEGSLARDQAGLPKLNGELFTGEVVETMPDGRLLALTTYAQGRLDGPFRAWSGDGVLVVEGQGRRGRTVGTQREWFNDGSPKFEREYDEHGEMRALRQWDEDGTLLKDNTYPAKPR